MEKIKYIIIFTLVLGLGLLYMQIDDYDDITNSLLLDSKSSHKNKLTFQKQILTLQTENTKYNQKINLLEINNTELNDKILILQEQIISLEENHSLSKIKTVNTKYTLPTNDFNLTEEMLKNNENNYTQKKDEDNSSLLKPNVTIDDENKITGFGVEYSQEF